MLTITGTVGSNGKYLVTAMPVGSSLNALLKIVFENNTPGTNLSLCAGSPTDFQASTGAVLSSSGGPGFKFLTIINASQLSGKDIYVLRKVGTANSQFTIDIE